VPLDPVRGGELDAADAVYEAPLRPPPPGTEDGALKLGVAVEPRLVGAVACVIAELVDKPIPSVGFADVFPTGAQGADNSFPVLGVWAAPPA
jgi:hypothetical protein